MKPRAAAVMLIAVTLACLTLSPSSAIPIGDRIADSHDTSTDVYRPNRFSLVEPSDNTPQAEGLADSTRPSVDKPRSDFLGDDDFEVDQTPSLFTDEMGRPALPAETPAARLVDYEIRYISATAEEVYVIWALDGWNAPERTMWPEHAIELNRFPFSSMERDGDHFRTKLRVPEGATLDYCFNVRIPSREIDYWDVNTPPRRDYHSVVSPDGMALVIGQDLEDSRDSARTTGAPWTLMLIVPGMGMLLIASRVLFRKVRKRAAA